jgi:16S rRNA (guanine527-N7)-methyltransferase
MSTIDPAPLEPPPEFLAAAAAMGIEFDPGDVNRLGRYLALLLERNRQFNLTAITDPGEAWTRHVLDSLSLLPLIGATNARAVIDLGSGGGLPGIPLAIAQPTISFTLVEATGKKARFLEDAVRRLDLDNVIVVNDRAETVAHDQRYRAKFDVLVARAVGPLVVLAELAAAFVRVGGCILAIKGRRAEEEIAAAAEALRLLHCAVVERIRTSTGTIVVIEKTRGTPAAYPRRPGEPKRAPLRTDGHRD